MFAARHRLPSGANVLRQRQMSGADEPTDQLGEALVVAPLTVAAPRVDPRLLEILVCPVTRASLSYDAQRQELVSRAAKLAYPIRDGIPIMLPGEARNIDDPSA